MLAPERAVTAIVLAGLMAWPVAARCQRISGRVNAALTDKGLPGAQIFLERAGKRIGAAVTDSSGSFSLLADVVPGTEVVLRVLHIGYRMASRTITVEDSTTDYSLTIALERAAVELSEIAVVAQRTERKLRRTGFYDREKMGFGHFVTEKDILATNARLVTDALRGIPGVRVAPSGRRPGAYTVYLTRAQGRLVGGACPPRIFLDGIETGADFDDFLTPDAIAGIEIYRGPAETPAQYGGAESNCGVILFWTK